MTLDARLKLFVFLAGLFITSLIVGDLIGGKLYDFELFGLELGISAGMIPFPVVFLLTDLINEFYGKRAARYVTFVGFMMVLFTITVLAAAVRMPFGPATFAPDWGGVNQASFDNIFASSQRILVASAVAYLIAQLVDIGVFHYVKRKLGGRFLWLRATGSTVVSQLIDTIVIGFLAWYGLRSTSEILGIIATSYVLKVVVAVAITPLIYAGHAIVARGLGLEPAPVDEP